MTGEELLGETFDFMCRRLPQVPDDDPLRGELSEVLAALGVRLGRPLLNVVPIRQEA